MTEVLSRSTGTSQQRDDVRFSSEMGHCAAWVYRPAGASAQQRVPVIVLAHGIGGVRGGLLDVFAERFCAAGYACVVFDYRHFGDSSGVPRELIDISRQRADWRAAVAFARTLAFGDPDRVVAWGTSFGGGHAIATGADDPRIAAVIAQCPFTDGLASVLAISPVTNLKLLVAGLRDTASAWFGREPVRVPLTAKPGNVGLMTSADAHSGFLALVEASGLPEFRDQMAARFALKVAGCAPGRHAKELQCPALFVVCNHDTVAPTKRTLKHVSRAPRGEIVRYPGGHFEIYVGAPYERNITEQLRFLATHVPTQGSPADRA